jgi:hypothetical protein
MPSSMWVRRAAVMGVPPIAPSAQVCLVYVMSASYPLGGEAVRGTGGYFADQPVLPLPDSLTYRVEPGPPSDLK